jgi:Icc-related predicted phosphoesterase
VLGAYNGRDHPTIGSNPIALKVKDKLNLPLQALDFSRRSSHMIIDCISDLHGYYPHLEGGDLLIVAGDLTLTDTIPEYKEFYKWFESQNYRKKILVGGNHDNFLMQCISTQECRECGFDNEGFEYLCDTGIQYDGLTIWGSPWTLTFPRMNPKCMAFTCYSEEHIQEKWDLIPIGTDIVVTHMPPKNILDNVGIYNVGSESLLNRILHVNPKLHVFGHIHEWGGKIIEREGIKYVTKYVNASHMNEIYDPVNLPVRVIL